VSRPPVASERLALTASGQVRYALKTPYRDGTTHGSASLSWRSTGLHLSHVPWHQLTAATFVP
jgi:hypothetical protein